MSPETLALARTVIDEAIRTRYGDVPFVKITVTSDTDQDGEEFLWVKAIYDGEPENIDTRKSVTMVRHIRPKLAAAAIDAFPVISYIARSDLKKGEIEAI